VDEKNKAKFSLLNFNRHCSRVWNYSLKIDILVDILILLRLKITRATADLTDSEFAI